MLIIGERIKMLRESHNLSQAALAKRLGITRSSVNAWELGLNVPSTQYIIELSEIFKVSTDYLLCVAKTQTLDLTGLDEEDIAVLYALATHLRRKVSAHADAFYYPIVENRKSLLYNCKYPDR